MDTETVDTAVDTIERFCFSSFMGTNEIVSLKDAETGRIETFVICEGLPLTYLRALTVFLGQMHDLSVVVGLPEGDDDGIARVWARIKLPDSQRKVLDGVSVPNGIIGLAMGAFHRKLMDFVETDVERVSANAQTLLLDAISNVERRQEESRQNPVLVRDLDALLAPLLSPPWWVKTMPPPQATAMPVLSSY